MLMSTATTCICCQTQFTSLSELIEHMKIAHSEVEVMQALDADSQKCTDRIETMVSS